MRRLFLAAPLLAVAALCLGTVPASAAGNPVSNATNACGSSCIDVSFLAPGHRYLLKDHSALTNTNNVIALAPGSNGLPAEDFSYKSAGTVVPLYCTFGGQAQAGSVFTANQCHLLVSDGYAFDQTYQLAFNPDNGGPETMCLGDWDNDVNLPSGWKARLEPCGVTAATVLIGAQHLSGASTSPGAYWVVSGASNNFSNPEVLTVADTTAWQAPKWETLNLNGTAGVDTQEVRATPGPF